MPFLCGTLNRRLVRMGRSFRFEHELDALELNKAKILS